LKENFFMLLAFNKLCSAGQLSDSRIHFWLFVEARSSEKDRKFLTKNQIKWTNLLYLLNFSQNFVN